MSEHTPVPWYCQGELEIDLTAHTRVMRYRVYRKGDIFGHPATCEREADAEYIVRVCNSHSDLLEVLRDIGKGACMRALLGESDDEPCWCPSCRANTALAKAEGR